MEYSREPRFKKSKHKPGDGSTELGALLGSIIGLIIGIKAGMPVWIITGLVGGGIIGVFVGSFVGSIIARRNKDSDDRQDDHPRRRLK